ncbi:MAG TPA: sigma-70 family RNA polymerase sigma factor [Gammaproteobacteria bacterium]|nr:sigma-70 family RNA polymerase sigma factor [Gammaproteobacteria bacterium]
MDEAERDRSNARLVGWMAACARGEVAALQELYSALSPQLFALLLRILQRRDLAEEALQETFMSVWSKASEYQAIRGQVATWALAIARYRAFDILRRERYEVALEPETLLALCDAETAKEDGDESPLSLEERRRLRRCLEALPAAQRSSVVLAYFWGRTQEEIAARLDAPLGTVKSWVRRSLASLKRCLER